MQEITAILKYPLNLLLLLIIIAGVFYLYKYHPKSKITKSFSSLKTTIFLSLIGCGVMIIDGTFALGLHKSVFFISILIAVIINLLFVIFKRGVPKSKRSFLFALNHVGILLILVGGIFGYSDKDKHKMIVSYFSDTNLAYNLDTTSKEMDFSAKLENFEVDYWDKNSKNPKEYLSEVTFDDGEDKKTFFIKVNSPIRYKNYKIYQDGYDKNYDGEPRYTVLLLVKDTWLPITYAGIIMMIIGGGMMIFRDEKKRINE